MTENLKEKLLLELGRITLEKERAWKIFYASEKKETEIKGQLLAIESEPTNLMDAEDYDESENEDKGATI